jgi:hypothetical protein
MNQIEHAIETAVAWYQAHRDGAVIAGLGLAALLVGGVTMRIVKHKAVDRAVMVLSFIAAFGFSAQGMYEVVTHKAHVPGSLALVVFFVAEAFMVNSMIQAKRLYLATTERDEQTGKVTVWGTTGKHGRTVWIIAGVAGALVAFSSTNPVEFMLRGLLPLGAALQWWNTLTGENVERSESSFIWTPRRLGVRFGVLGPRVGDEQIMAMREAAKQRRLVKKLVTLGSRARATGASDKDRVKLGALTLQATVETRAAALVDLADAEAFTAAVLTSTGEQNALEGWTSTDQNALEASTQHSTASTAQHALPVGSGAPVDAAQHGAPVGQSSTVAAPERVAEQRTDEQLVEALREAVERESALAFREAARVLGDGGKPAGNTKVKRLIGLAGLAQDAAGKVVRPVDGSAPVNGHEVGDLVDAVPLD